jgi:hypothetical protein
MEEIAKANDFAIDDYRLSAFAGITTKGAGA